MKNDFREVLSMKFDEVSELLCKMGVSIEFSLESGCSIFSPRFFLGFDDIQAGLIWLAFNLDLVAEIQFGDNRDGFFILIDPEGIENTLGLVEPEFASGKIVGPDGGVLFFASLTYAELREAVPHLFWCEYPRLYRISVADIDATNGTYEGVAKLFELTEKDVERASKA